MNISLFKRVFKYYGILGSRHSSSITPEKKISQKDLYEVLPYTFTLCPRSSLCFFDKNKRNNKNLIGKHLLENFELEDSELTDILFKICKQYFRSSKVFNPRDYKKFESSKYSVSRLRSESRYNEILDQQNGRCAISGTELNTSRVELDHVIPWRIGGDPSDGSNWQLLSKNCNLVKGSKLSSLQSHFANTWYYGMDEFLLNPESQNHHYNELLYVKLMDAIDNGTIDTREHEYQLKSSNSDAILSLRCSILNEI